MPSQAFENLVSFILENQPDEEPTLSEQRENFENIVAVFPPAEDATSEPVEADGVPAEWVTVEGAADDRVVCYLHGGGYCIGSANTHRNLASHLSRASGARVLDVDYRLAPEHPFPAALEDARTAYRWLVSEGYDPRSMAVAGDSAGGGLTIATLVSLRDDGGPLPAAAVALSPWVDLEITGSSATTKADEDPIIHPDGLKKYADAYLAGQDARTPLASPLYADLSGLPPLLVHVGGREVLLDDATRLAERAREAGVDVTLEIRDEMIHIWHFFAGLFPEADEDVAGIGSFLRRHLA